jgi:hypothetical protein
VGVPERDYMLLPASSAEDHEPLAFDTSVPHPARRYNYWLGGKDNFAADRASGDAIARVVPTIRLSALENRRFLGRAVSYLAREAGIRQFLDIGTGIPAENNTHEVAQSIAPDSRVVYVDNDPIVLAHARALLRGQSGRLAYIDADLREPESILCHSALTAALDLDRPVGLMLVAILHFLRDEYHPFDIVRRLLDALPAGSFLVVSHATHDFMSLTQAESVGAEDLSFQFRAKDEFAQFFEGLELVEPGITSIAHWRAEVERGSRPSAAAVSVYGAVGRIPTP